MKLSSRDKKLITILRDGPATGKELAEALGVSRRTILRDANRLNSLLQASNAGHIKSGLNYSLHIESQTALETLIQSSYDEATEVLVTLLCSRADTIRDIAEETLLSFAAVHQAIDEINTQYHKILRITLCSGRGLRLEFFKLSPTDLLAALCMQNKAFNNMFTEHVDNNMVVMGLLSTDLENYRTKLNRWISPNQVNMQVAASLMTIRRPATASDCCKTVRAFIDTKIELYEWLMSKRLELMGLAADLLSQHGVHGINTNLPSLIFDHVVRASLFPTLMSEEFYAQVEELRIVYPFEFDFARMYCGRIESMYKGLLLEPELCALYVIGTASRIEGNATRVLLLSSRKSLESVNRALLEQTLGDTQIVSVEGLTDALQKYRSDNFDIFIRDESISGVEIDKIPWNLSYKGILRDRDMYALKRIALYASYRKLITYMLPKENYVTLEVNNEDYEQLLKRSLDYFVKQGRMSAEEASSVIVREQQGERLQFSGVAIPHCVTKAMSSNFRLFAITLDKPIRVNDENIRLILIVFASTHQNDKNTIFSYLYSAFTGSAQFEPGISYEELIEMLSQVKC